ncbi:uncharacterized protein LOC126787366 [Argentina anserina]|uniref:uncharacterized protein LOC126787366 n=1 Tax=Argentina anserina TaxID=57926 RepID=UPI002176410C|nr:uncharacterized protein LOC126787366 [Potentilla anserina]
MNSDLSLFEIAGEDDSLLHPTPLAAAATADDAFFLVSPLQPPRSRPKEVAKANVDRDRDGMNKQNTNLNKIEENKFSLQPQQMKRKKKGGFNMRKSLAWDRAFFEEEGVLNSEELSMITGSGNFNSSGSLSVIEEEASCGGDSAYLQDLEENIFKVIPGSTPKKDRISGGSPLPKHASPARDNAVPGSAGRRKVLSAHDSNRSGSKRSGCPRPMASSSYPFD